MTRSLLTWVFRACLLAGFASGAHAQMTCRIDLSPPLVFGVYNALLYTDVLAQTEIAIACTGKGVHLARVELARDAAGAGAVRFMRHGGSVLRYGLYQDAALSTAWGDGTGGTHARFFAATPGRQVAFPVYARIPARQNIPPGRYTDTVTVRVDW